MPLKLNPGAQPFVPAPPAAAKPRDIILPDDLYAETPEVEVEALDSDDSEEGITPECLEELEATEAWVEQMALCEELEREHLILFALQHAPAELVEQIERRAAMAMARGPAPRAFAVKTS